MPRKLTGAREMVQNSSPPPPSPNPTIGLSATTLSFNATAGGVNPPLQTISVSNTGGGTLSWSATDNAAWLTASKSGSTITASVNISGLTAGTFNATITVTDPNASNNPQPIPVTLILASVSAPPSIGLSPTSLAFSATEGGANPASQTLTVGNTGGGTLFWSVSGNAGWLSTVKSGSTVTVSVDPSGLTAGSYNGIVTVSDPNATNNPQTASVTLTVNAAPPPSATLSWDANSESDLAGYKIYRSTTSGVYGAPIATVSAGTTSYQDTVLSQNTTYFWVVAAFDTSGNESGRSNEVNKSIF